jgi:hypothetical protein
MNPRTLRTVRADERPAPRVDELSATVVAEAVDELAKLRTPSWLGDTAIHLHALASLITQAERLLPAAVHAAREQELTWAEIGQLLNLTPSTAARRYKGTHK